MKIVRDIEGIRQAVRQRRDELNISHETIDQISGVPSGYTSKLLAPQPLKQFGIMSLPAILGALALGLVVVEDQEQKGRVAGRWQKRKRPQKLVDQASRASITAEVQETPVPQAFHRSKEFMKRISKLGASKGGKSRAKIMGKRARQRIATHAARMRWAKREKRE